MNPETNKFESLINGINDTSELARLQSVYGKEVQICQIKGLDSVTEIILDCRPDEVCEKIQEFVGKLKFEYDDAAENLHISFNLDFEGEKSNGKDTKDKREENDSRTGKEAPHDSDGVG